MALTFAEPSRPTHVKMGIYGEAGSGKTYTAALEAIGIVEELRKLKNPVGDKPVYMFDTEKGSDWLIGLFAKHDIVLKVVKSQSFVDLIEATKLAEKEASVFIVDSIVHVWKELMQAYLDKSGKTRMPMHLWAPIKQQWREFTDLFVNSPLHIIVCGRAKDNWEYVYNEDTGKKELITTDSRMGGEKEMSYEPDLLIEMTSKNQYDKKAGEEIRVWEADVQKDRSDTLKSKRFINPSFESFRTVWELLDIGGKVGSIDTSRNSPVLVNDQVRNVSDRIRRRKVASEEIQNAITKYIPGRSADDQKAKLEILEKVFGTSSWTAITEDWNKVPLEMLEAGVGKVEELAKARIGVGKQEVKPSKPKKGTK